MPKTSPLLFTSRSEARRIATCFSPPGTCDSSDVWHRWDLRPPCTVFACEGLAKCPHERTAVNLAAENAPKNSLESCRNLVFRQHSDWSGGETWMGWKTHRMDHYGAATWLRQAVKIQCPVWLNFRLPTDLDLKMKRSCFRRSRKNNCPLFCLILE